METERVRYVLLRRFERCGASGSEEVATFAVERDALVRATSLAAVDARKREVALACAAFESEYATAFPAPVEPDGRYEATDPPPPWRGPDGAGGGTEEWLSGMGRTLRARHARASAWRRAYARDRDAFLRAGYGTDWRAFRDAPGRVDTTSYDVEALPVGHVYDDASEWFERFA